MTHITAANISDREGAMRIMPTIDTFYQGFKILDFWLTEVILWKSSQRLLNISQEQLLK